MKGNTPLCKRCNQLVVVNQESYDVFEQMHWLCFHREYEHNTDPDEPCRDPSCPWLHIEIYKAKLIELGHGPQEVINDAISSRNIQ